MKKKLYSDNTKKQRIKLFILHVRAVAITLSFKKNGIENPSLYIRYKVDSIYYRNQ